MRKKDVIKEYEELVSPFIELCLKYQRGEIPQDQIPKPPKRLIELMKFADQLEDLSHHLASDEEISDFPFCEKNFLAHTHNLFYVDLSESTPVIHHFEDKEKFEKVKRIMTFFFDFIDTKKPGFGTPRISTINSKKRFIMTEYFRHEKEYVSQSDLESIICKPSFMLPFIGRSMPTEQKIRRIIRNLVTINIQGEINQLPATRDYGFDEWLDKIFDRITRYDKRFKISKKLERSLRDVARRLETESEGLSVFCKDASYPNWIRCNPIDFENTFHAHPALDIVKLTKSPEIIVNDEIKMVLYYIKEFNKYCKKNGVDLYIGRKEINKFLEVYYHAAIFRCLSGTAEYTERLWEHASANVEPFKHREGEMNREDLEEFMTNIALYERYFRRRSINFNNVITASSTPYIKDRVLYEELKKIRPSEPLKREELEFTYVELRLNRPIVYQLLGRNSISLWPLGLLNLKEQEISNMRIPIFKY